MTPQQMKDSLLMQLDTHIARAPSQAEMALSRPDLLDNERARLCAGDHIRVLLGARLKKDYAENYKTVSARYDDILGSFGHVVVSVEGGPTYKILNTRERLTQVRNKVESCPGFKVRKAPKFGGRRVRS